MTLGEDPNKDDDEDDTDEEEETIPLMTTRVDLGSKSRFHRKGRLR